MRSENSNIQIKQELVNSIVHGFGIIFGVVSILIALAIKSENMAGIVSRSIWLCFLQLFTFSTLYHGIQHTSKTHLKSLITSVFISAGTYTRFTYVYAKFLVLRCYRFCHRIRNNLYDFF
jgi:hemolysin III